MPIKANLTHGPNGAVLHAAQPFDLHTILVTTGYFETHGVFKTAQITTATTTDIASPSLGGYLIVTNILLSAEKQNGGTVIVEFDDGVNTEILYSAVLTNSAVNISVSIPHGWRGWENASVKVVSNSVSPTSITIGYVKLIGGDAYAAWDARR